MPLNKPSPTGLAVYSEMFSEARDASTVGFYVEAQFLEPVIEVAFVLVVSPQADKWRVRFGFGKGKRSNLR